MRGSMLGALAAGAACVSGVSIEDANVRAVKWRGMDDTKVESVLAQLTKQTGELFGGGEAQRSWFYKAREAGKGVASRLGLAEAEVDSVTYELESMWREMKGLIPGAVSQLQFMSQPRAEVRPREGWDVMRLETFANYQLRVNRIADPSKLGIDPAVKQYSGYLDVEDEDKHFFFWAFESRNDPSKDPVVLWLNGGPGCSSLTGLFFELGPSSIGRDVKPVYNPYSWTQNATVVFLDQPVNTGYSYSSAAVSNTVAASADVYAFLSLFFTKFPQYNRGQAFHIAGESYAGHYIPVFASEILSHPERNFNLSSVLIGNGLTDPLRQYPHYRPMACGEGGEPSVLAPEECSAMDSSLARCLGLIRSCYALESIWTCVPASIYCNNAQLQPVLRSGKNTYDLRKECSGILCYDDLKYMEQFLNLPEVMEAVGAEVSSYASCNFDINRNFMLNGDWMKPYVRKVAELVDAGLPVLIYAGDKDFICNWLGNKAWVYELDWKHRGEYQKQTTRDWIGASGKKAGEVTNFENLTFLRIFDAGHMVPYDQPENSLLMLNSWLSGDWALTK